MRIAFSILKYFIYGGLQRDFRRIVEECVSRGYTVDIYTLEWHGDYLPNVNIHIIPVKAFSNHVKYKKFAQAFAYLISEKKYDVVVGFNKLPYLNVYFAGDPCYEAKVAKLKSSLYRYLPRYRYFSQFERSVFAIDASTDVLYISEQQKQEFIYYYHTQDKRFHYMPPWLTEDKKPPADAISIGKNFRQELGIANDEYFLLLVGSGFKTKGLDRALLAIHALPNSIRAKVKFYIIGNDKFDPFARMVSKLSLQSQVKYLGGKSNVQEYMLAADLLLHPAYAETAGIVILEAIVNGLPVLTTDVCGYAHHVTDANAGVVLPSPFSQHAMNQVLSNILEGQDLQQWGSNGIQYYHQQQFSNLPKLAVDVIERTTQESIKVNSLDMTLNLPKSLASCWEGKDLFDSIMNLQGEIFRHKDNRKTLRFSYANKKYFAKLHLGVGWFEIFKNIVQFRLPVIGAQNEWRAILRFEQLQIPTMKLLGFGQRGNNPATQQSFLITEELANMMSLEDLCRSWQQHKPPYAVKYRFIELLAEMMSIMHQDGLNHRDCYFCHILLARDTDLSLNGLQQLKLYLIDLHRVQMRNKTPRRWLVKDLGSLYFSAIALKVKKRDALRFIKLYTGKSLRQALTEDYRFWREVEKKGLCLYEKACRKLPEFQTETN